MNLRISKHAYQRARERLYIPNRQLRRILPYVCKNGIRYRNLPKDIKEAVDKVYIANDFSYVRYHAGVLYIFENQVLKTLYPLKTGFDISKVIKDIFNDYEESNTKGN